MTGHRKLVAFLLSVGAIAWVVPGGEAGNWIVSAFALYVGGNGYEHHTKTRGAPDAQP